MTKGYVEELRLWELRQALAWLPPRRRILEIGAGIGWQAREMSRMGHAVDAVDLANSTYANQRVWPIRDYDGVHLPFVDSFFDVVFTSNVLEHVWDLSQLTSEMRRVVKTGGHMVHVVPSATWRLWTTFTYYPDLIRRSWRAISSRSRTMPLDLNRDQPAAREHAQRPGWRILRSLLPPAHGTSKSALDELRVFRRAHWREILRQADEDVVARSGGLFYSGYMLMGARLTLARRESLAAILGSSCHIFVITKH